MPSSLVHMQERIMRMMRTKTDENKCKQSTTY